MRAEDILLWLSCSPGVGAVSVRKLHDHFGSWQRVWEADVSELQQGGVRIKSVRELASTRAQFDPVAMRKQFERDGIRYISQMDAEYPEMLRALYDPPAGLFVMGNLPKTGSHALAVVGARTLSAYGRLVTEKLVTELVQSGLTIVSGLARGIDTAAHGATLKAGGQTIAVLGSGLLQIYPRENMRLAHRIADGHGAVISEWAPLTPGRPQNFPIRNRIISGLTQATLVIEAGEKSGSLITADQALEQGRDVYAVPGPITSPMSIGTNRLIQHGAKPVLAASDILEDYELLCAASSSAITSSTISSTSDRQTLDPDAKLLLQILGHEEVHLDVLLHRTGMPQGALHTALLRLQLQGKIAALPGNRYLSILK
ncbi:DNA-protecting protein DprA [Tumebacillus algifaecis]|uniref:DNA-protecting protein DprA n=1 Tax=Tumebacillus algifaecis TaxID=1214604 RepID=A0A223D233_9BACL|nr:DNA-processing protein DprA [Tumebacillus algifaecis]ASS75660.1 DNA-protecting protein DprA [Tumebacillus algifaecis]